MATLRMSLFYSSVQPRNAGKQTGGVVAPLDVVERI